MECVLWDQQRDKLRRRLCKIHTRFKNEINFNVIHILFPHFWQGQPRNDDKDYQLKITNNIQQRIKILREVIEYVFETNRFDGKYGI